MKHLSLYILILLVGLVSCHKEEITDINTIDNEDPTAIEGVFFKGTVKNGNFTVADATIDIYQNETIVGTTKSNAEGKFTTAGIKLEVDKHVTFNVKKDAYVEYAERINHPKEGVNEASLQVMKVAESPYTSKILESPGSNDLVIISGLITTSTGIPVQNVFVTIFSQCNLIGENSLELVGEVGLTDENGEFSFLLPKNIPLYLLASEGNCGAGLLSSPDEVKCDFIPVQSIGAYETDATLPTLNNAIGSVNKASTYQVTANFVNCANLSVLWGTANVQISKGSKSIIRGVNIFNGELIMDEITMCLSPDELALPLIVNIYAKDSNANKETESLTFTFTNDIPDLGTIMICKDIPPPSPNQSVLNLNIGATIHKLTISLPHRLINAELRNDSLVVPIELSPNNGYVQFNIPNFSTGIYKINDLSFTSQGIDFVQEDLEITVNNFPFPVNGVNGTINGKIKNTTTGNIEDLSGFILVEY